MKELEVLEIASGLSKQALAMMFPRKCLWPETWIRNEAHSISWKVMSAFPHHCFLSFQYRVVPENVFSSVSLGNGLSISPCWLSNSWEKNMGVISSITKAAWILEEEWGNHCTFPALSRPPWRWVKGIIPLWEAQSCFIVCLSCSNRSREALSCVKRRDLGLLVWPSTPVYHGITPRETQDPAGKEETSGSNSSWAQRSSKAQAPPARPIFQGVR